MLSNELIKHDTNMQKYMSALLENLIKSVIKSVDKGVKSDKLKKPILWTDITA